MFCCGEERTTPFCPMCGRDTTDTSPLGELLAHVRKHAKASAAFARNEQARLGREDTEYIKKLLRTRDRWMLWSQSLAEMISRDANTKKDAP